MEELENQLFQACLHGNIEEVKELLENNPEIDLNYESNNEWMKRRPLTIACSNGHIEIVKLLLNHERIDINKGNRDDETPFKFCLFKWTY